jgi:arabinan endo-1,5-alpha-L-arabinosidase
MLSFFPQSQVAGNTTARVSHVVSSVKLKGRIKCLLLSVFLVLFLFGSCSKDVMPGIPDLQEGSDIQLGKMVGLGNVSVRDPALILADSTYYLFGSGKGIKIWSSTDLLNWKVQLPVFVRAPAWTNVNIPGFNNEIWAPEITFYKDRYYLFYSVSTYGSNNSAIGLATNETLNPEADNYKWVDQGMITQSVGTSWNAIDPNFVLDNDSIPHLVLGSFYSGIKITKILRDNLGMKAEQITKATLANRDLKENPYNAIEAPFVLKHNNYYYLFASINNCCSGINSDYKTIVGRSKDIDGIYVDKKGRSMAAGGGELVLAGSTNWHGAGGASVYNFKGQDKIVFFSHDNTGVPRLRIADLRWDAAAWPSVDLKD